MILNDGTNPVNPLPYMVKTTIQGIQICYPHRTVSDKFIFNSFLNNISLQSIEPLTSRSVIEYDQLSVTMQWRSEDKLMSIPLVRGSPYITAIYKGLTAHISTQHAVLSVNNQNSGRIEGFLFIVTRYLKIDRNFFCYSAQ